MTKTVLCALMLVRLRTWQKSDYIMGPLSPGMNVRMFVVRIG